MIVPCSKLREKYALEQLEQLYVNCRDPKSKFYHEEISYHPLTLHHDHEEISYHPLTLHHGHEEISYHPLTLHHGHEEISYCPLTLHHDH